MCVCVAFASVQYGQGSVVVQPGSDVVSFGGITARVHIGVASSLDDSFKRMRADGATLCCREREGGGREDSGQ